MNIRANIGISSGVKWIEINVIVRLTSIGHKAFVAKAIFFFDSVMSISEG